MTTATTSKNITIYSTATCAYCHAEKEFLTKQGISFDEKHVDVDAAAAEEMIKRSSQMGVPYTVVTDADGTVVDEILGFDQARLSKALDL